MAEASFNNMGGMAAAENRIAMERKPLQSGALSLSSLLFGSGGPPGERQAMLAGSMAASLSSIFFLFVLLLFLLFVLACRPWRFFTRRRSFSFFKADDIERPFLAENSDETQDLVQNVIIESNQQIDGNTDLSKTIGVGSVNSSKNRDFVDKNMISIDFKICAGDSLVPDVVNAASENHHDGKILKRLAVASWPSEGTKHTKRDSRNESEINCDNGITQICTLRGSLRSSINLEVIAGPSCGLCCSRCSTDNAILPLALGRVSPNDLILNDSEVSGKHAHINWNILKSKWELVDMGSLNGTFLNSNAIHHPVTGSRNWSEPAELISGDIITLGSYSKICVQIVQDAEDEPTIGVGIASDPMAMRRGGKKLPMEDMCYCRWPLPGVEQFGLFSIFDGHGGAGAARAASKILPQIIVNMLTNSENKRRVITCKDASDVLKEAFSLTEAALNHQYEGCTATVLLVWFEYDEEMFIQCANVGDSACILDVSGKHIIMTEDHRLTSMTEQTRLSKAGWPLLEGETRLCGLNLGRMLGDKFLKDQDKRFSAEPFVSQVVRIAKDTAAFGLIASDGLWDVMSTKQAAQLVFQTKERYKASNKNTAESIANCVLSEARSSRTKDNTSVVFLDFDLMRANTHRHN